MEEQKKEEQTTGEESKKADLKESANKLEALLDEYMVKKAPFALPTGVKEFIVAVAPYLTIIFAIMAIPIILAALGLSAFLTPFAMLGGFGYGLGWGFGMIVSLVVAVITLVMELMAVPGMFKRKKSAWRLLFYASIVSFIGGILSIHGIVGAIIGAIIGWYILFQVKDMYKN
ncbi:MAG TPA: hypothetical protein P5232_02655 [Candidatus Moranbacteria bacterium]|nr:hypothetical protein [Candidatus Moranbacteria bacterium]